MPKENTLGEVIKKVVDLPRAFMGVLYELLERLSGEKGNEWFEMLKAFLRREPCWFPVQKNVEADSLEVLVQFLDPVPKGAVYFKAISWSLRTGVAFNCLGCCARFVWPNDAENRWLPNRRYLNHCPGCGNQIAGCYTPKD